MTLIKEQAIELIKKLPDDKVIYIVNILEGLEGLYSGNGDQTLSKSQMAYQTLQRLRRKGTEDIDYREELAKALEDRYESLG